MDEARLNDKTYNWGYDPKNYNVPEGSYSTDPADPAARIREFKQMVQSLHRNGMRIVLDVVYNHTASVEHSNFNLTVPGYFYRHIFCRGNGHLVVYSHRLAAGRRGGYAVL